MESFRSDVDNITFNETLNVNGSSMTTSFVENTHAPISANTDSEERSTDVVNQNMQIMTPEIERVLIEEAEAGRHQLRSCQQDEYFDGEELAEIDCGHIYHIDCIKEWNLRDNTCPICKRKVSVVSHFTMRISAFLAQNAAANQTSSGSMN
ncbi:unnamed protein product [Withania somnifera]